MPKTTKKRTTQIEYTDMSAVISDCGLYRYSLQRVWQPAKKAGFLCFLGLNPSKADGSQDDPTIRRCVRFTRDQGLSWLVMLNLFAIRETKPALARKAADPIGPENDDVIRNWVYDEGCRAIVCCWGEHAWADPRVEQTFRNVFGHLPREKFACYGWTANKRPRHPLFLPADSILKSYYYGTPLKV